jgi:hypothetical protein
VSKEVPMVSHAQLSPILNNDALTRGLGDPEARLLVEWLVERAEQLADGEALDQEVDEELTKLCRWGRSISRFVSLWCYASEHAAAVQLAAVERFPWPLPCSVVDPCELMADILDWEAERLDQ